MTGSLAFGIYFIVIGLLIYYFNTKTRQESKHFVKKNEERIQVALGSPEKKKSDKPTPKKQLTEKPKPKAVAKPKPKPVVKESVKKTSRAEESDQREGGQRG
jgi:outer membrane biosynthesis protein TonB